MYTLAHNRLVDWYRRNNLEQQSFQANEDDNPIEGSTDWNPDDELQTMRLSKQLKHVSANFLFEQREIFLLHQEASLTIPHIADMLQEAVEKIKSRYRYAIDKLRKMSEVIR